MTGELDTMLAREALAALPECTSHGESPTPAHDGYIPASHRKAMDPT